MTEPEAIKAGHRLLTLKASMLDLAARSGSGRVTSRAWSIGALSVQVVVLPRIVRGGQRKPCAHFLVDGRRRGLNDLLLRLRSAEQ